MSKSLSSSVLIEQQQALLEYFDSMLNDAEILSSESQSTQSKDGDANASYDVLLIKSAGLTFAIPADAIGDIISIDNKIESLPIEGPSWLVGVLRYAEKELLVINPAKLVAPNSTQSSSAEDAIVILGNSNFGLACEVLNRVLLNHGDIYWREELESRSWLLGTSQQPVCALIDPQNIISEAKKMLSDWLD